MIEQGQSLMTVLLLADLDAQEPAKAKEIIILPYDGKQVEFEIFEREDHRDPEHGYGFICRMWRPAKGGGLIFETFETMQITGVCPLFGDQTRSLVYSAVKEAAEQPADLERGFWNI